MAAVIPNKLNYDSLQREPDIEKLQPLPMDRWPDYMLNNQSVHYNEEQDIKDIKKYFERSVENGYEQAQPYAPMFTGPDMALDQVAHNNKYMKLIFGGKPDPITDNIDMAYNHSLRQMAEAPVTKDSLIGHQNPNEFVPGTTATKDSLLKTFAEQRRFYKGTVDTDAERMLKTRPTHKLIMTTTYGKNLGQDGSSGRYNTQRGQWGNHQFRPKHLEKFRPFENLSSRTYAPDGSGGEVPLNYENTNGVDPRIVEITKEKRISVPDPKGVWAWKDLGSYAGNNVDQYMFNFADTDPGFAGLFHQFKPRM